MKLYIFKIIFTFAIISIFTYCDSSSGGSGGGGGSSQINVYIDPSAGINGDGSQASPFNTWSSIVFEAGHSYLQKRGTVAREEITVGSSGTASSKIIIDTYGTGADPIIQGSETVSGWSLDSASIYSKTFVGGEYLGMVAEDGTVLNYFEWDTNVSTTFSGASAGSFSFNYSTSTMYVWSSDSADPDTHTMEVSQRQFGIHGDDVTHIQINNIHVRYVSLHGVAFANSSYIDISNCHVEKLGGAVIILSPIIHAGNGIEFGNASSNCTVTSVVINDIFDSGISPQTYDSNMNASNFTFTDSTVSYCGFAGVEIVVLRNGSMINSSIDNVTIRNITIESCGQGWSGKRYTNEGRGIKVQADIDGVTTAGNISNVLIENCTVSGSAGEGIFVGGMSGTVTINRCLIKNNDGDGILAQDLDTSTTDILLNVYSSIIRDNGAALNRHGLTYNILNGNGLNLIHNTFYNNDYLGLNIWNHSGTANIINNIFDSSSSKVHFYSNVVISSPVIENNYFTEFRASAIINYNSTVYSEISNGSDGFDDSETFASGNIGEGDAGLNADLTISNISSPAYHTGQTGTGISTDYSGSSFNSTPSIGAYEY